MAFADAEAISATTDGLGVDRVRTNARLGMARHRPSRAARRAPNPGRTRPEAGVCRLSTIPDASADSSSTDRRTGSATRVYANPNPDAHRLRPDTVSVIES